VSTPFVVTRAHRRRRNHRRSGLAAFRPPVALPPAPIPSPPRPPLLGLEVPTLLARWLVMDNGFLVLCKQAPQLNVVNVQAHQGAAARHRPRHGGARVRSVHPRSVGTQSVPNRSLSSSSRRRSRCSPIRARAASEVASMIIGPDPEAGAAVCLGSSGFAASVRQRVSAFTSHVTECKARSA
jgi:hypothetical protein